MQSGSLEMRDRIMLPEIPVQARVGCTEQERAESQMLLIDVELRCDVAQAAREDSIEAAIDYVAVRSEAERVAGARPYALIETIAEGTAASLLERFATDEVRVRVRKPTALAEFGVPWAGVEVVRNKRG